MTSTISSWPSPGWARGATSQGPSHWALMAPKRGPREPAAAGHEVGDEPVQAAVDQDRAQVHVQPGRDVRAEAGLVASPAEGAAEITAEEPERRDLLPCPPGGGDHGPGLGVGAHDHPVLRQRSRAPPVPALLDGHVTLTPEEAATTPRSTRRMAARAVSRVVGVRSDLGDLTQQVQQLADLAHEVPAGQLVVAQDLVELVPLRPFVGQGDEAGIRFTGEAQGQRGLLLEQVGGQVGQLLPPVPQGDVGKRRGGCRFGAAVLVGEAGQQGGQVRSVEVVEQAVTDGLGHEKIALVVEPGEPEPGLGQGPAVQDPAAVEDLEHPVELAGPTSRSPGRAASGGRRSPDAAGGPGGPSAGACADQGIPPPGGRRARRPRGSRGWADGCGSRSRRRATSLRNFWLFGR